MPREAEFRTDQWHRMFSDSCRTDCLGLPCRKLQGVRGMPHRGWGCAAGHWTWQSIPLENEPARDTKVWAVGVDGDPRCSLLKGPNDFLWWYFGLPRRLSDRWGQALLHCLFLLQEAVFLMNCHHAKLLREPPQCIPTELEFMWGDLLRAKVVQKVPHMSFLPRNRQSPLHHLLDYQTSLSQCPEPSISQQVKELLGLIVPLQGARWGITAACGMRWERSLSAHFLRRWFSRTFWLIGPTSLIREGFQCLHLTSCRFVIGEGVKLLTHFSRSTISQRNWRSEYRWWGPDPESPCSWGSPWAHGLPLGLLHWGHPLPFVSKPNSGCVQKDSVQVSLSPTTSRVGWSSITNASSSVATLRHESISTWPSDWCGSNPWFVKASWNHGGSLRNDLPNGEGTNRSEACMILSQEKLGPKGAGGRQSADMILLRAARKSSKRRKVHQAITWK